MTPGRRLASLPALALVVSLAACAPTKYDASISVGTPAPTTTVLPVGSADQLLPQLVSAASQLSALIADQGDKFAAVERIEALWAAVRAEVQRGDRDIATEIEAEIAKGRRAATFNRPGAADKVYRDLNALVQAYLEHA